MLLATYNGARFLAQQLDSLLTQTHPNTTILARDDGSSDTTGQVLADYASRYPQRITVFAVPSAGTGAAGNFLTLLRHSTAPYVAFADQDDVWLPDKLTRQLTALEALHTTGPALCFTDLQIVDEDLHPLYGSFWQHERHDPATARQLTRLVMQNVVAGCTALLNRPLADLAAQMPPDAHMHDWWTALLACAFGESTWLAEPTVLYRQHGANVFGASSGRASTGLPDRRNHLPRQAQWQALYRQAQAFQSFYAIKLTPAQRKLFAALGRCETSPHPLVRVSTLLSQGLTLATFRQTAAMLLYLWDKPVRSGS